MGRVGDPSEALVDQLRRKIWQHGVAAEGGHLPKEQ